MSDEIKVTRDWLSSQRQIYSHQPEARYMDVALRGLDALERAPRVRKLLDYWPQVTPPGDWAVMRRFVADLRKALDGEVTL